MDSGEFNKIAGGVLAMFLVFLLLNFAGGKIYGTGEGGHHGEEVLAYAVELDTGDAEAEEEEEIDLAALVASADPAKGEKVFNKCKSCHKVEDGANGLGPTLWGVVNRDIGSVDGFGYSNTLAELPGNWDLAALDGFLANPKGYAKGTSMGFAGLKKPEDRVNLIVWLNEADGSPDALE
ncbi:MAG: cytochrome c family protein [Pseudomonadota bacterium]